MNKIVSIQVAATCHDQEGVTIVGCKEPEATHYSVYTRDEHGCAEWIVDYAIRFHHQGLHAHTLAMLKAAELSREHRAFIEPLL